MAKEAKQKLSRKEKKALKNNPDVVGDLEEVSIKGKIGGFFIALFIILIWLAGFAVFVKLDVGGFGSSVLSPLLQDVPIVKEILPKSSSTSEDSSGADADYSYETVAEAIEQIKVIEQKLADAQTENETKEETITELNTEIERLQEFEEQQDEYQKLKSEFDEEVVFNDNAPDISEYKAYYESIDPDNAELLYKQVVEQIQYSEEVEDYAEAYSKMKPAEAAGIFEEMTNNLDLVAEILENMDTEARGDILGAMDAEIAAKVTNLMAP